MKAILRLLTLGVLVMLSTVAISQDDKKSAVVKLGDKYFEVEDYYLAAEYYAKELEKNADDAYSMFQLGECNRQFFDYGKAEQWYAKAEAANSEKFPLSTYYLAKMMKINGRYVPASEKFEFFIATYTPEGENDNFQKRALVDYNGCILALDELKKPQRDYDFRNVGDPVNSSYADYSVGIFEHDTSIVLASGRIREEGSNTDGRFGEAYNDNIRFKKYEEGWLEVGNEVADNFEITNSEYHDAAGVFNTANDKYYFTRCSDEVSEERKVSCAIFMSKKEAEEWTEAIRLNDNVNPKGQWNAHPTLTTTGDTMYFASKRPGGKGLTDIWMSIIEDPVQPESWGTAINLGEEVNSPFIDQSPSYYSTEKILFFASNGHESFGGLDIFMARGKDLDTVRNVGLPFNSNKDDFFFTLGTERGYLSSNRDGGLGGDDIYTFNIHSREALIADITSDSVPGAKSITISGRILDDDGDPAEDVRVLLTDVEGNVLKMTATDEEGIFIFANLDPDKDYRVMLDEEDGILTSLVQYKVDDVKISGSDQDVITSTGDDSGDSGDPSDSGDPTDTGDQGIAEAKDVDPDITTKPSRVLFENIYFDVNKDNLRSEAVKVLDELVAYTKANPEVKVELSGHTDSQGSDGFNLSLAKRRGQAAYDYLTGKGVKRSTIIVNAIGESAPVASNTSAVGRQLNRRVEFHIVGGTGYETENMAYVIGPRTTYESVASKFNISIEQLKELNGLGLSESQIADLYTVVRVPRNKGEDIISQESLMHQGKPSMHTEHTHVNTAETMVMSTSGYNANVKYGKPNSQGYYIVLPRNTLFSIAKIHEISVDDLIQWNGIKGNMIYPGQKLKVADKMEVKLEEVDNSSAMPDAGITVSDQAGQVVEIDGEKRYVVKDGDSFYSVCKEYNLSFEELREMNALDSYLLKPNMVLKIEK